MEDRAKQALAKMALEPQWEARFEPNSYGFRPGRSCQDAVQAIFLSIYKMLYSRILELIHLALTEFLSKRIKNQDLIEILLSPCSLLTIADMCKQLVH